MEIRRSGSQPPIKGLAEWFTGNIAVEPCRGARTSACSWASVRFEPVLAQHGTPILSSDIDRHVPVLGGLSIGAV
jgi:hypothetical protein